MHFDNQSSFVDDVLRPNLTLTPVCKESQSTRYYFYSYSRKFCEGYRLILLKNFPLQGSQERNHILQ